MKLMEDKTTNRCEDCGILIAECENWSQSNEGDYECGACEEKNNPPPSAEQMNYIFGEGGW